MLVRLFVREISRKKRNIADVFVVQGEANKDSPNLAIECKTQIKEYLRLRGKIHFVPMMQPIKKIEKDIIYVLYFFDEDLYEEMFSHPLYIRFPQGKKYEELMKTILVYGFKTFYDSNIKI